jgi:hypothetical protein
MKNFTKRFNFYFNSFNFTMVRYMSCIHFHQRRQFDQTRHKTSRNFKNRRMERLEDKIHEPKMNISDMHKA